MSKPSGPTNNPPPAWAPVALLYATVTLMSVTAPVLPIPPPVEAVLFAIVTLVAVKLPPASSSMAPPVVVAELLFKVTSERIKLPPDSLASAPPLAALLPVKVISVKVRLPELSMAPPLASVEPSMIRTSEIAAVTPPATENTPELFPPLIVTLFTGASLITSAVLVFVSEIVPSDNVIVCGDAKTVGSKTTVLAALPVFAALALVLRLAQLTAARNVPTLFESETVVTAYDDVASYCANVDGGSGVETSGATLCTALVDCWRDDRSTRERGPPRVERGAAAVESDCLGRPTVVGEGRQARISDTYQVAIGAVRDAIHGSCANQIVGADRGNGPRDVTVVGRSDADRVQGDDRVVQRGRARRDVQPAARAANGHNVVGDRDIKRRECSRTFNSAAIDGRIAGDGHVGKR